MRNIKKKVLFLALCVITLWMKSHQFETQLPQITARNACSKSKIFLLLLAVLFTNEGWLFKPEYYGFVLGDHALRL